MSICGTGKGATLLFDYFSKLKCGIFGPNKVPKRQLIDAIWIDGGYALDAPEMIPAGGMTTFMIQDDVDPMGEQLIVSRGIT